MSKPLLWILGDSYGENVKSISKWKNMWTWPQEITRIFDVENFAIAGSGPQTQIEYFLNNAKDRELEYCSDINVIFFVSDPARINFNFYQTPFHQTYPKVLLDNPTKIELDWKEYYKDKNKFIMNYFKYIDIMPVYETEKYISILKMYSKFFKKILVFNCFQYTDDTLATSINDEKFHLINNPMININNDPEKFFDCPNHLSLKNHKIMYSQLVGHFLNNQNLMHRKFLRND